MLLGDEDTNSDSDNKIEELGGGAGVKFQSGGLQGRERSESRLFLQNREQQRSDNQETSSNNVSRDPHRFEEVHQCNCGHKGPIASHLRTNQQCVQGFRDELSLGAEMSDESLIVKTTLVLQGCPAISCAGGNHDEIPELCISWWKECGWNLMQWEEFGEDLTSRAIKQKCKEFLKDLMQQNYDRQEEMNKTASDDNKNAADKIQRKGNMEETTTADLNGVFLPGVTSMQVQKSNGRQKGGKRPAANVSTPWDF